MTTVQEMLDVITKDLQKIEAEVQAKDPDGRVTAMLIAFGNDSSGRRYDGGTVNAYSISLRGCEAAVELFSAWLSKAVTEWGDELGLSNTLRERIKVGLVKTFEDRIHAND